MSVTVAPSGTRRIALAVATSCDLSEARALWESWAYTTPGLNNTSERSAASRGGIEPSKSVYGIAVPAGSTPKEEL